MLMMQTVIDAQERAMSIKIYASAHNEQNIKVVQFCIVFMFVSVGHIPLEQNPYSSFWYRWTIRPPTPKRAGGILS